MIWVKRFAPLVLIVVIYFGYRFVDNHLEQEKKQRDLRYAEATAKVWVASAEYRDNPERFIAYRDSLLAAEGLSPEQMQKYLDFYEDKPEEYLFFVRRVSEIVDSIVRHDLSPADTTATDTIGAG